MKIVVQKYGGSSVATPELMARIADRVIATKKQGCEVVVVVSALGETTDHLVDLSQKITQNPPRREMDMLLSVGERISISLLAMAISQKGAPAISFTGSQVGIITNTDHTRARILEIRCDRIRHELQQGRIVVVAGYQGVSTAKEITTLGRGGSDTTAVALAAALNAERCEIMTDVDGIYTANPRKVKEARLIPEITHGEMLDMAELGSQVLKSSAVEFAQRHNIKIHVGSSFTGKIGTIVTDGKLDRRRVTGIAIDENVVLLTANIRNAKSRFGLIRTFSQEGVVVRYLNMSETGCTLIFKKDDIEVARQIFAGQSVIDISENADIGLLSIVGVGINFETDVMNRALAVFSELKLTPEICNFSETRLSFAVNQRHLESLSNKMHSEFLSEIDAYV